MRSVVVLACSVAILAGCAIERRPRYYSEYEIAGEATELSASQAEVAHIAASNAKLQSTTTKYDKPLQLLSAPQPIMPPADTEARVIGRVVAELLFAESGEVQSVSIIESTKESLAQAVHHAVSQWRIAPATSEGKPTKVVARQAFNFKTDW